MQLLLKRGILNLVETLKKAGKLRLADCIEENWHKSALEYSKELNFWRPKRPIEKELENAFGRELERLGFWEQERSEILHSIKKRRIIQTAPHLGATEGPRMLYINWLGSLGVPEDEFYVVGMFSGIPFSNRSRPGRINRKNDSVNLFPSTLQDGMVYRSRIHEKFFIELEKLPPKLVKFFPSAIVGDSYTRWALATCQHIERRIFKKNNLVYLDINEVVSMYLEQVLSKPDHVFHKLFFNPEARQEFMNAFPGEIMFYIPAMDGKYEEMENVYLETECLASKSRNISLKKEILISEIRDGRLCPGLLISFLALAFLNQFKCFGSFAQVEYLPVYQEKLAKLSFMQEWKIETIPTSNLTTGIFPEKRHVYPIDIILDDIPFEPVEDTLYGEYVLRMKGTLIDSYFTGDLRNKNKKNETNQD